MKMKKLKKRRTRYYGSDFYGPTSYVHYFRHIFYHGKGIIFASEEKSGQQMNINNTTKELLNHKSNRVNGIQVIIINK